MKEELIPMTHTRKIRRHRGIDEKVELRRRFNQVLLMYVPIIQLKTHLILLIVI